MNNRDESVYINHILDEILKIENSFKLLSKRNSLNNEELIDAYFRVDLEAVWIAVKRDIPLLKEDILNIKNML